jgi:hypothetical protein
MYNIDMRNAPWRKTFGNGKERTRSNHAWNKRSPNGRKWRLSLGSTQTGSPDLKSKERERKKKDSKFRRKMGRKTIRAQERKKKVDEKIVHKKNSSKEK